MDLSLPRGIDVRPDLPVAVFSPHPLMPSRERLLVHAVLYPGETLGEYLERVGIAQRIRHHPVRVTIDGMRVPHSMWWHCRPKPGTLIQVQALLHGGDGGKNPIAMVLIIALMIVAPYAAPALGFAAGSFGAMAITAGINLVGGMVINSLFPPPKPQLSQASQGGLGGLGKESPTYALSGGSNRARPYEPMPTIMGTHLYFFDAGAKTYTEFEGEDQFLYQVFEAGYNDIDFDSSTFKIGATPLDDYSGVTLEISGADGRLTLFPANIDTVAGADITFAAGAITRTSSPNATALAVDIVGSLYALDSKTGEVRSAAIQVQFLRRLVGAASWESYWGDGGSGIVWIGSATRKPLRVSYRLQVPEGQYEVKIQRLDADGITAPGASDLAWSQLRTYQADTADYTGRKRVALKIKASGQLSGSVAQLSAIARARTDVWNGSAWVTAETSNPAWWVLKAARGEFVGSRKVWGGGIPEARIGLENIKAFGAWCDAKGLTFNGVFDRQLSVYDMLSAIAARGRGSITRAPGMVEVVWDAPDQPAVAVFGMSNIKLDTFEIEYVSEVLADEIVLSFINPDNDWQTDIVRALAPGVTDPVRSRTMDLFGCTNVVEAGHDANLYVANNIHRTKKYRWQMDWEGMPVSRGEVGYLSHDLASYDYSGRLIEGTTASSLKLERQVALNAAGAFITIVKPDGTFTTYPTQAGTGDSSTINLVDALPFDPGADPDHPPYDYRWLYGHTATPGKKVKIEAFAVKGYDTIELTAIDETPDYYDSEENPYIHVPVRPIFGNAPAISNVQITEDGVLAGQGYLALVFVTWDAGPEYSFADIRVSVAGGPFELKGQEIRGNSFDFLCADQSEIVVEIIGYGRMFGRAGKSTKVTATADIDFAAIAPPSNVEVFSLQGNSFSWTTVGDVDVIGYRIRFHYNELTSWDDANELHAGLLVRSPSTFDELPPNLMSYGIKSVDAAGLESPNALWISVDARAFTPEGDPLVANVTEVFDFQALGWPGTITGGTIVGGEIVADVGAAFYNEDGMAPMYGADSDSFYRGDTFAYLTYETDVFTIAGALVGSRMTLEHDITGEPIYVDYRKVGSTPFYGDDADPFYGDDADPFYDAPGGYAAWPGGIFAENAEYQIRLRAGESAVQGIMAALTAAIDAPDITETFDDISIDAGGTRLPISRDYEVIKNVQVTLQNDAGTAVTVTIEDKDPDLGPLLKARNSSQVAVAATADAVIQGY